MSLLKIIGWLGAQLLAWCAAPAAIQVLSQGHANGYSGMFIAMWLLGEILCLIYVYFSYKDKPLMLNYLLNIVFISVIVYHMV